MKCPFIYKGEKPCSGYISEVKFIKADVGVTLNEDDQVVGMSILPRYHIHLFCSQKGNHVGFLRPDSEQMKVWQLPEAIMAQIEGRQVKPKYRRGG